MAVSLKMFNIMTVVCPVILYSMECIALLCNVVNKLCCCYRTESHLQAASQHCYTLQLYKVENLMTHSYHLRHLDQPGSMKLDRQ